MNGRELPSSAQGEGADWLLLGRYPRNTMLNKSATLAFVVVRNQTSLVRFKNSATTTSPPLSARIKHWIKHRVYDAGSLGWQFVVVRLSRLDSYGRLIGSLLIRPGVLSLAFMFARFAYAWIDVRHATTMDQTRLWGRTKSRDLIHKNVIGKTHAGHWK